MFNSKPFTLFILIVLTTSGSTIAQEAFNEIRISPSIHQVLTGDTILNSWTPATGLGLELTTPYYTGYLEGGYRYIRYNEFHFPGSGFHSHYIFVGWNYSIVSSQNFSLSPGFRVGNRFMLHDQDMVYGEQAVFSKEESEFSYEVLIKAEHTITEHISVYFTASYNRTVFNLPYSALYGSAGISFSIQTPGWLKQLMK